MAGIQCGVAYGGVGVTVGWGVALNTRGAGGVAYGGVTGSLVGVGAVGTTGSTCKVLIAGGTSMRIVTILPLLRTVRIAVALHTARAFCGTKRSIDKGDTIGAGSATSEIFGASAAQMAVGIAVLSGGCAVCIHIARYAC